MFSGKRIESDLSDYQGGKGNATIIARGVRLQGDFTSQGDVVIEGEVQGHVQTTGQLLVGPEAKLNADVSASDANIAGTIEGTLIVQRRLDLKSTARVSGDVTCQIASIEAGATLEGHVKIGGATEMPTTEE